MSELKPCPFCGNEEIEVTHVTEGEGRQWWDVECLGDDCAARPSVMGDTEEEAVSAWNSRPSGEGKDGDLTVEQIADFERYASENIRDSDGSQSQWAEQTLCLIAEVRRHRASGEVAEQEAKVWDGFLTASVTAICRGYNVSSEEFIPQGDRSADDWGGAVQAMVAEILRLRSLLPPRQGEPMKLLEKWSQCFYCNGDAKGCLACNYEGKFLNPAYVDALEAQLLALKEAVGKAKREMDDLDGTSDEYDKGVGDALAVLSRHLKDLL